MRNNQWAWDILIMMIGTSLIFVGSIYFKDKLVTGLEIPISEYIEYIECNKTEKNCGKINIRQNYDEQGKLLLLSNGPIGEKTVWLEQENDFDINKIYFGKDNFTANIAKNNVLNGRFDKKIINFERINLPPMEQVAIIYYSNKTKKRAHKSKKTTVIIGDKRIGESIIISPTEMILYAIIFSFLGALLHRMATHIKWR